MEDYGAAAQRLLQGLEERMRRKGSGHLQGPEQIAGVYLNARPIPHGANEGGLACRRLPTLLLRSAALKSDNDNMPCHRALPAYATSLGLDFGSGGTGTETTA